MAKTGKKKPSLSKWDALDAVPVKNRLCQAKTTEEGVIQISVAVRPSLWTKVARRLTRVPKYRKIELDEIGTFVWNHCDGRTNVRALIKKLCKRFKLSYREGEVSLTQYLRTLARRNLIGLAVGDGGRRKGR